MTIDIETSGVGILFDLLKNVEAGASNRVPGGATIMLPELPPVRTGSAPAKISLKLTCCLGVDATVTGNWLYENLKSHADKLWINKVETPIDRKAITRAIKVNKLQ